MHRYVAGLLAALAFLLALPTPVSARVPLLPGRRAERLDAINRTLAGRILDFTDNHGCDRRIYSRALCEKRDLYIYLPPGYDGQTQFPGVLWLHGIGYDEQDFLEIVGLFDCGIRQGAIPPCVIAAPDGSIRGRPSLIANGSFYLNSPAGRFEDFVAHDVWDFLRRNFAIRPEREAHVIGGVSMGGFGAFSIAFKHRDEFGQIAGIMPPLNLRYADCRGRYFANYDPSCVMLRPHRRREVVGRFYGVLTIRARQIIDPLIGPFHPNPIAFISAENPIEMLKQYDIRPGEFGMFIGYGTEDEFNIDAQVEHFLDVAAQRGIRPDKVVVVPGGQHNRATGLKMVPELFEWATDRLGRFTPPGYDPTGGQPPVAMPLCAVRRPGMLPAGPLDLVSWLSPDR